MTTEQKKIVRDFLDAIGINEVKKEERMDIVKLAIATATHPDYDKFQSLHLFINNKKAEVPVYDSNTHKIEWVEFKTDGMIFNGTATYGNTGFVPDLSIEDKEKLDKTAAVYQKALGRNV